MTLPARKTYCPVRGTVSTLFLSWPPKQCIGVGPADLRSYQRCLANRHRKRNLSKDRYSLGSCRGWPGLCFLWRPEMPAIPGGSTLWSAHSQSSRPTHIPTTSPWRPRFISELDLNEVAEFKEGESGWHRLRWLRMRSTGLARIPQKSIPLSNKKFKARHHGYSLTFVSL